MLFMSIASFTLMFSVVIIPQPVKYLEECCDEMAPHSSLGTSSLSDVYRSASSFSSGIVSSSLNASCPFSYCNRSVRLSN